MFWTDPPIPCLAVIPRRGLGVHGLVFQTEVVVRQKHVCINLVGYKSPDQIYVTLDALLMLCAFGFLIWSVFVILLVELELELVLRIPLVPIPVVPMPSYLYQIRLTTYRAKY